MHACSVCAEASIAVPRDVCFLSFFHCFFFSLLFFLLFFFFVASRRLLSHKATTCGTCVVQHENEQFVKEHRLLISMPFADWLSRHVLQLCATHVPCTTSPIDLYPLHGEWLAFRLSVSLSVTLSQRPSFYFSLSARLSGREEKGGAFFFHRAGGHFRIWTGYLWDGGERRQNEALTRTSINHFRKQQVLSYRGRVK